jgi:hypothetical protein
MLMRPKHSFDRLLTLKASGVRDLMGSFTAHPVEEMPMTLGCPARGPVTSFLFLRYRLQSHDGRDYWGPFDSHQRCRSSKSLFAVHESRSGTFETCRRALKMSGVGGGPEVIGARHNDAIDPGQTCDRRRLDRQVCLRGALRLSRRWDHCHAAKAVATLSENTIGEVLQVSA